MSLELRFIQKDYEIPNDIIIYLNALQVADEIKDSLFRACRDKVSKSEIRSISTDEMVPEMKKQACIYLCRIISSCEICMDRLKEYNNKLKTDLEKYSQGDLIPHDIYSKHTDKTYNVISYLVNLLGDCQKTSISYFKYRKEISKRIKRGSIDIPLVEISQETAELMNEFNKMRNWLNHTPESLLISEMELVKEGKMCFPMDPVEITHYYNVTYDYFEHLYLSNDEFYKNARQIIQVAKRDYSLLMGKSIEYPRVYLTKPLGVDKSQASKRSAKIQGLQSELDGE